MMTIDQFIELKSESINTIGITDGISEEYLKEICEEYCELKLKKLRLGDTKLSFNELKDKILTHKAKSEYKQASIIILRDIFETY